MVLAATASATIAGSPSGLWGNFAFDGTDVNGAILVIEFGLPAPVPMLPRTALGLLVILLSSTSAVMLWRLSRARRGQEPG